MERLETLTVGIEGQELDVGLDQEDWRGFDSGDHDIKFSYEKLQMFNRKMRINV